MPIDRNRLEQILADPDFMALPENEQDSFLSELEQSSQKGPSFEDVAKSAIGPIYEPAKAIAKGYMGIREAVTEPISHALPEGGPEFPISAPLPIAPTSPIPLGRFTGRQALKELAGMGFDQAATLGLAKAPKIIGGIAKGTDKLSTSLIRRLGGLTSGDIKSTRALTSEFGPEFVFSKTKAKPEYLGREIAPKATEAIKSNIRSMEPSALMEAGVPDKSIRFSQKVKKMTGIKELPTKGEGDKFFEKTIESLPDDITIDPVNFRKTGERVIADIESGLGKNHPSAQAIRFMLNNLEETPSTTEAITSGAGKIRRGLSKRTFTSTRRDINRLFGGNDEFNRFIQPLKEALDKDASLSAIERGVSAPMGKARTMYRLPRELSKGQTYIDKPNLAESVESELRVAQNPERVQVKESLKGLLGSKSSSILKDLEAQRLAKEFYPATSEESGSRLPGIKAQFLLKGMRRSIPRAYESSRAKIGKLLRGNP